MTFDWSPWRTMPRPCAKGSGMAARRRRSSRQQGEPGKGGLGGGGFQVAPCVPMQARERMGVMGQGVTMGRGQGEALAGVTMGEFSLGGFAMGRISRGQFHHGGGGAHGQGSPWGRGSGGHHGQGSRGPYMPMVMGVRGLGVTMAMGVTSSMRQGSRGVFADNVTLTCPLRVPPLRSGVRGVRGAPAPDSIRNVIT